MYANGFAGGPALLSCYGSVVSCAECSSNGSMRGPGSYSEYANGSVRGSVPYSEYMTGAAGGPE